ncbi:MAG: GatB/YqeY domain-containing protein [Gammaproteobacteria bacterium]|nr:GatB/YqeY domain-containing protein [Gammaproteobacteria bacterium]MDH3507512.1 GatB/YqeY domain-containing protein [Gammaproteobacteria bacterium]
MSSTKERLQDDVKAALKAGDRARLGVLRMVMAAIKQREVDSRETLDDGTVLGILEKMVKQRQDAIIQFERGGRNDLVTKETAEIDVIRTYLPEPLDEAALTTLIEAAITDTGATAPSDMGRVMAEIKKNAAGRADMGQVSQLVRARLTAG